MATPKHRLEYNKEWREKNKEKIKERNKEIYKVLLDSPEKLQKEKVRLQQYQDTYRKTRPLKYLYNLARRRAKARGIDFNIELADLKWPDLCPLLEIKLDQAHPEMDYHGSIDRIDSTKGYIKGNVMIISHRANRIKSNATARELELLAKNLKKFEGIS